MSAVIHTDARGRASLGHPGTTYLLHEEPDGTLILEPASVISDMERRYMSNTALRAQVRHAQSHPEEDRPRVPRR